LEPFTLTKYVGVSGQGLSELFAVLDQQYPDMRIQVIDGQYRFHGHGQFVVISRQAFWQDFAQTDLDLSPIPCQIRHARALHNT